MDISNKKEYLAMLLLYVSRAVMEISGPEKKFIKREVGQAVYNQINGRMKVLSDFDVLQSIAGYREKFYPGQSGKAELEEEIRILFDSDGDYSEMERMVFLSLRKIF